MVDRHDIDALLIGALYGELTPADEARLQAHLESHPADRTALADLTLARNAVRESRILQVQVEPPQSVSALLLQEAARRAPKPVTAKEPEREGWFQRFMRSFAAHPAMAAAAMLVLVLGVAGTLYLKKGDHFAEPKLDPVSERIEVASGSGASATATPAPEPSLAAESEALRKNAGSAFGATLKEDGAEGTGDQLAQGQATADNKVGSASVKGKDVVAKPAKERRDTYLNPQRRDLKPKELDDERPRTSRGAVEESKLADAEDRRFELGNRPGGAPARAGDLGATSGAAPPPPPAPPATVASGRAPMADKSAASDQPASAEEQREANDPALMSWAKETHQKVVAQVRSNNCKTATTLALELSTRAPNYYQHNVETDRALKQCVQYINAARAQEAERVQRARATQRRTEDAQQKRAAPATTNK